MTPSPTSPPCPRSRRRGPLGRDGIEGALLGAQEALCVLVRRYLHAYGPAAPRHFARWAAAPAGWADGLFGSLTSAGVIEEVAFEGAEAWVAAGDTGFPETPVRGVRLLPYFDACVIAAQPHELLVDGTVAGVWHQRRQGRRTTVTVEPLGRLTAARERELGERVERVGEVLEARAELVFGEVTVGPHA